MDNQLILQNIENQISSARDFFNSNKIEDFGGGEFEKSELSLIKKEIKKLLAHFDTLKKEQIIDFYQKEISKAFDKSNLKVKDELLHALGFEQDYHMVELYLYGQDEAENIILESNVAIHEDISFYRTFCDESEVMEYFEIIEEYMNNVELLYNTFHQFVLHHALMDSGIVDKIKKLNKLDSIPFYFELHDREMVEIAHI